MDPSIVKRNYLYFILLLMKRETSKKGTHLSAEEIASDPELSRGVGAIAIFFILGLISILEGIFSIRGAKDASKIMPAWIFALIGLIGAIVGLFMGGSMGSSIASLIVNIVIFIAANKIKKSRISG